MGTTVSLLYKQIQLFLALIILPILFLNSKYGTNVFMYILLFDFIYKFDFLILIGVFSIKIMIYIF
ncbi:hypothetical protein Lupro_01610 [Lutibacter profundi]|uniref:Uncharacterized protein n=1 Tax=Lutibacter profundi TaxID=1622118 RepID=A0A109RN28_9FLAO|nr:hypothetical protein Lupro_01610 [Lutibacter profundi]